MNIWTPKPSVSPAPNFVVYLMLRIPEDNRGSSKTFCVSEGFSTYNRVAAYCHAVQMNQDGL